MLKNIDFLLPNQHEILLIQEGFDSPIDAAENLIKKGVKNSVHTEPISEFVHFLIENKVEREIKENIPYLHFEAV